MAEKGMFVKFMPALRKHIKEHYPFAMRPYEPIDVALPKSRCLYLGVSPIYGKHVIVQFCHSPKSWEAGQVTIDVHISTEYHAAGDWNAIGKGYDEFEGNLYSLSHAVIGTQKIWCLRPNAKASDRLTSYWSASSYECDETVIREAILDCCRMLESLFRKAGLMAH